MFISMLTSLFDSQRVRKNNILYTYVSINTIILKKHMDIIHKVKINDILFID